MKTQKITTLLEELGLTKLEQACYVELLKKSPQRASDLAQRLETPKATVLLALSRLVDGMGVVERAQQKNSFVFSIDDPQHLLSYVQHRAEELATQEQHIEQVLPELRTMQQFDATKPAVQYVEGKEGMKKMFFRVLEEADEIIGYGSNEDDLKYLPKLYPDYYAKRVAKKIPVRAIIPATTFNLKETIENAQKHLRNTHFIPAEFNFPIQVNIYKNTIIFFSFEENFALTIRSKPIADCLKKMFELAFEQSVKGDQKIRSEVKER